MREVLRQNARNRYIEAQVHGGPIRPQDIDFIRFTRDPSETLQADMKKLGIEWRVLI